MRDLIWKTALKANEKLVLLFILDQSGADGGCVCSRELIATRCGLADRNAASKVTAALVNKGLLEVISGGNTPDGIRLPNTHKIMPKHAANSGLILD